MLDVFLHILCLSISHVIIETIICYIANLGGYYEKLRNNKGNPFLFEYKSK